MFSKFVDSPALVRVVPFAIFLALTFLQERCGETGRYWIYFAKTIAGGAMLLALFRHIAELEWRFTWEAFVVGVLVFVMWVGLDEALARLGWPAYPKLKSSSTAWNPNEVFGIGSPLTVFFVVMRIVGSTLVVPPLEEIFYRSFVYRFLASKDFLSVPLGKFLPVPFLVTSVLFGFEHREWLAGILCGFAYQGLVMWKNRLGDAITAHGTTNFLLGLWVVWKGAWQFW
ncbi:MAG TPA: CAAX prenyl protease-related protein [Candidatus Limnocylindria bacterium]|nr:CAAX prenyl protease-related protein [Candidatus Limnocylindria bacterium]